MSLLMSPSFSNSITFGFFNLTFKLLVLEARLSTSDRCLGLSHPSVCSFLHTTENCLLIEVQKF